MVDVRWERPPDERHEDALAEREEDIESRLQADRARARKRLRDQGFDEDTIETVLGEYERLEEETLRRAGVMSRYQRAQMTQPIIEQETDTEAQIWGTVMQGVGTILGQKMQQDDFDWWGIGDLFKRDNNQFQQEELQGVQIPEFGRQRAGTR